MAAADNHLPAPTPMHAAAHIPLEILGEIFSHCDTPTLAVVSLVSFDCLALSAKLLYEDITLQDARSLGKLLGDPVSPFFSFPLLQRSQAICRAGTTS